MRLRQWESALNQSFLDIQEIAKNNSQSIENMIHSKQIALTPKIQKTFDGIQIISGVSARHFLDGLVNRGEFPFDSEE